MRSNIESLTVKNKNYRKVLHTNKYQQLVLMSLNPSEDIPIEKHVGSQFIRIEKGRGRARIWKASGISKDYILKDGVSLIIPPKHKHYIWNTSKDEDLKLYSIYSPPEHQPGLINKRQPFSN